ncbi:hypothetical protein ACJX0J_030436, partial [Zea mays]
ARAAADSPYGVYSKHIAAIAPPPLAKARSLETGTKLHISNLDSGVTIEDVQELFSEVGELKRYSMNYDKDGRSKGTVEVVFARKVDALDAIKRYNGVLLDGKPMNLELIGNNVEPPPMPPVIHSRPLQNYNDIHSSMPQSQRGGQRRHEIHIYVGSEIFTTITCFKNHLHVMNFAKFPTEFGGYIGSHGLSN